ALSPPLSLHDALPISIYHLRQELWLVTVGENPVACWVTGRGEAFPGELLVLEAFGNRQALAASLQPLLAATGTEQACLPLLEGRSEEHTSELQSRENL